MYLEYQDEGLVEVTCTASCVSIGTFLRATTVNHRQNFSPDEDEGFLEVASRRLQQLQNIREDAYATGALRQKVYS